jgi:hypothetical protein
MKACLTGALLASLVIAGCSGSSGITTAALLGDGGAKGEQAAAPVVTPTDRALQVSATSARAERCGFYFDPQRLRTNFLAAEAQNGLGAPEMQKITLEYDTIHAKLAAVIAEDKGFCTEAKTREIKKDLNRHLAGDFSPPPKKAIATGGWFEDMQNAPTSREVINRDLLTDPTAKKTKRIEE